MQKNDYNFGYFYRSTIEFRLNHFQTKTLSGSTISDLNFELVKVRYVVYLINKHYSPGACTIKLFKAVIVAKS